MARIHTCEICGISFMPKKGAKRVKYCSQKCNQRAYNARLKQQRKARNLTVTLEEAHAYDLLSQKVTDLDNVLDRFQTIHGNEATLSLIRVLAHVSTALGITGETTT